MGKKEIDRAVDKLVEGQAPWAAGADDYQIGSATVYDEDEGGFIVVRLLKNDDGSLVGVYSDYPHMKVTEEWAVEPRDIQAWDKWLRRQRQELKKMYRAITGGDLP